MAKSAVAANINLSNDSSTIPTWVMFQLILIVRLIGARLSPIADCDETFNYWEPMHYLVHHHGLQTWEYSPEFALRSYSYLWIHALPSVVCKSMGFDKVTAFFATRGMLGFVSAVCETFFLKNIKKRFGITVQLITFFFLIGNAGMFFASVSYLPSTTCMYAAMTAFGYWFDGNLRMALFAGSFAVLSCWPFSALMFIPMGVHALLKHGIVSVFTLACVAFTLFFIVPSLLDSYLYYGKIQFPIANIVLYNVFNDQGANLYGTEPWTFYFFNLFLNLNIVPVLGSLGSIAVFLSSPVPSTASSNSKMWCFATMLPMCLTLALFTSMDHKEERFLFILYPLLCLSAALCITSIANMLHTCIRRIVTVQLHAIVNIVLAFTLLIFLPLSISRCIAVVTNFKAPIELFNKYASFIRGNDIPNGKVVCMGKEWYRFPTSYFLFTYNETVHDSVGWVESGFHGLLPQEFPRWPGTMVVPLGLNDENKENVAVYRSLDECDFLVDFAPRNHDSTFLDLKEFEKLECIDFMNTEISRSPWRSFYVPSVFSNEETVKYDPYCLLKRRP